MLFVFKDEILCGNQNFLKQHNQLLVPKIHVHVKYVSYPPKTVYLFTLYIKVKPTGL